MFELIFLTHCSAIGAMLASYAGLYTFTNCNISYWLYKNTYIDYKSLSQSLYILANCTSPLEDLVDLCFDNRFIFIILSERQAESTIISIENISDFGKFKLDTTMCGRKKNPRLLRICVPLDDIQMCISLGSIGKHDGKCHRLFYYANRKIFLVSNCESIGVVKFTSLF